MGSTIGPFKTAKGHVLIKGLTGPVRIVELGDRICQPGNGGVHMTGIRYFRCSSDKKSL
jgi:hypothetical protein